MSDDETAIRALIQSWLGATRAGDLALVLSLMTDDVVFLVAGQEPFGKREFAAMNHAMKGMSIEGVSEVKEVMVSGDLAYCRTHLTVTMVPPDGKPVRRAGHTLSVLRKEQGSWRIARDANLLTSA